MESMYAGVEQDQEYTAGLSHFPDRASRSQLRTDTTTLALLPRTWFTLLRDKLQSAVFWQHLRQVGEVLVHESYLLAFSLARPDSPVVVCAVDDGVVLKMLLLCYYVRMWLRADRILQVCTLFLLVQERIQSIKVCLTGTHIWHYGAASSDDAVVSQSNRLRYA